jgi:hypothetical protein
MGEDNPNLNPDDDNVIEIDLEEVIGNILDSRGLTKDSLTRLEKLDTLDGLESLFEKHKSKPTKSVDTDALTSKIEEIFDSKLKGIDFGGGRKRNEPGWLSKFLFGGTA